jgi:methyl-accepting chemotaxis protein
MTNTGTSAHIKHQVKSMLDRTNYIFWLASVAGLIAALIAVLGLYGLFDTIERKTAARTSLMSLADELRQSSDDLTRFARSYAATGDDGYKNRYQAVLDIRNGRADRPQDYEHVYWDLEQIGLLKDIENTAGVPLLTRLRESGMDSYMVDLLATAKVRSDTLVDLERQAFALVQIGNTTEAVRILFSDEYHLAKGQIMEPIRRFQIRVAGETGVALDIALMGTRDTMRFSIAAIAISLILCCLVGLYRQVKPENVATESLLPS